MLFSVIASVSATCNVLVITDPTGEDPNGAAAGSMSFAQNMFLLSMLWRLCNMEQHQQLL